MSTIQPYLLLCRYCKGKAVFDVAMRHGAEYPACRACVQVALDDAYDHDGDHGEVTVYRIGEATVTLIWPAP